MDPSKVSIPKLVDLSAETITENTIAINSNNPDARMKYVLERLVVHLHDFARETRLNTKEWMTGIEFLTDVGKMCSDVRQSTEGTVLGPFHTLEAELKTNGESMSHDPNGKPLLVLCNIKDTNGQPIEGVNVDIWETDSSGKYDVQHEDYGGPDGRCVMKSDEKGVFWFKGIVPVSYPIPYDGPVGKFLKQVYRHPYRPAHMHFMFQKEGYDHLITALYLRGDPYETSDAVFGVKNSLIVDMPPVDKETAEKYGVAEDYAILKYDFVMVTEKQASDLRDMNSMKAFEKLGRKVRIEGGLPVPDVD